MRMPEGMEIVSMQGAQVVVSIDRFYLARAAMKAQGIIERLPDPRERWREVWRAARMLA